MQTEPVDADELRRAKSLALNSIPLSQASVDAVAGGLLHRAELGLPLDEPRRAAKRYASLSAEAGARGLREMAAGGRSRAGHAGPRPALIPARGDSSEADSGFVAVLSLVAARAGRHRAAGDDRAPAAVLRRRADRSARARPGQGDAAARKPSAGGRRPAPARTVPRAAGPALAAAAHGLSAAPARARFDRRLGLALPAAARRAGGDGRRDPQGRRQGQPGGAQDRDPGPAAAAHRGGARDRAPH